MRILNRPMFRYGGPIKEGVMHGMRQSKKDGGLSKQFNTGLVGDERYPKTKGREHHVGFLAPLWWLGQVALAGGRYALPHAMRYGSRLLGGGIRTGVGGKRFLAPTKSWWGKDPLVTGARKLVQSGARAKNVGKWGKVGKFATAPSTALSAAYMLDAFPGGEPLVNLDILGNRNILGQKYDPKTNKRVKGTGISSLWEDEIKPIEGGEISAEQAEILRLKKLLEDKRGAVVDPEAAKKLAKEKANERIQSYLDMMGYDSAKRGALDKALIDASALVQDATSEAGSLKEADWGKLINQAIQTTSKRLEKPEQIREAVGLMATKAAIEKDLEDPQVKKLRDLQIQVQEKALAGETLQDTINAAYQRTGEFASGAELAGLARTKGIEVDRVIPTADIPEDMSAIDYITTVVKKSHDSGEPFPPGNYVIKDRLVEIDATGNVTPVV